MTEDNEVERKIAKTLAQAEGDRRDGGKNILPVGMTDIREVGKSMRGPATTRRNQHLLDDTYTEGASDRRPSVNNPYYSPMLISCLSTCIRRLGGPLTPSPLDPFGQS